MFAEEVHLVVDQLFDTTDRHLRSGTAKTAGIQICTNLDPATDMMLRLVLNNLPRLIRGS
jgi:hypothetical protein